jgi:hypothetical protein
MLMSGDPPPRASESFIASSESESESIRGRKSVWIELPGIDPGRDPERNHAGDAGWLFERRRETSGKHHG